MTPEEKKKRKRLRIWRVAAPVLLTGLFAALAVFEKNGVFTALNHAKAAVEEHPAAVPVPLTRLAVMNRLENEGLSEIEGQLLREDADAGTLTFEEQDGAVKAVSYSLMLLPADETAGTDLIAQDLETAKLVFRSMLEAALGGTAPTQKELDKGDSILCKLFTSDKEKTEVLAAEGCAVTFTKQFSGGMYRLQMKAGRE